MTAVGDALAALWVARRQLSAQMGIATRAERTPHKITEAST